MLENLHVKNLAVIDETEVSFGSGLNIITGETGAGKSVIIGSVNLILGAKAEKNLIRKGAENALVELEFTADEDLASNLKEEDIYPEEGEYVFSRRIEEGKNVCRLNGEKNTIASMKDVSSRFIAIHGQHENQVLLDRKKHLKLLDSYASDKITPLLTEYREYYDEYRRVKSLLEKDDVDEDERLREISFLEYEISEIEKAGLKEGEDEALEEKYRIMNSFSRINDALAKAASLLGDDGASDMLGEVSASLSEISGIDAKTGGFYDEAMRVEELAMSLRRDILSYLEENEYDEEEFAAVRERLDLINGLKHRHGRTISDIMSTCDEKCRRLSELNDYEKTKEKLTKEADEAHRKMLDAAERLSSERKKNAPLLSKAVEDAMKELNFAEPCFKVQIEEAKEPSKDGADDVRFMIGLNPGDDLYPLEKTASGGELSRIMLSIRTVCALKDEARTIIFDEIDSGISGNTAQKVAEKLYLLSRQLQVICITHLPQIAAMADCHYVVEKETDTDFTSSGIRRLNEEESVMQIAAMSGGAKVTQSVIDSAAEMKKMANEIKMKLK